MTRRPAMARAKTIALFAALIAGMTISAGLWIREQVGPRHAVVIRAGAPWVAIVEVAAPREPPAPA